MPFKIVSVHRRRVRPIRTDRQQEGESDPSADAPDGQTAPQTDDSSVRPGPVCLRSATAAAAAAAPGAGNAALESSEDEFSARFCPTTGFVQVSS